MTSEPFRTRHRSFCRKQNQYKYVEPNKDKLGEHEKTHVCQAERETACLLQRLDNTFAYSSLTSREHNSTLVSLTGGKAFSSGTVL